MNKRIKRERIEKPSTMKSNHFDICSEHGITQSLISSYMKCPRSFLYKINGWQNAESTKKMFFGSIVHYVLDKVYAGKKTTIDRAIKLYKKIKRKEVVYIDEQLIENETAIASLMCKEYFRYYKGDLKENTFTDVEKVFDVYFKSFRLRGRKDAAFINKNKKWLMEHKTRSRISEDTLMLRLSIDFQNLFYLIADEIENENTVHGFLYNVVRKPQLRRGKNETLNTFCDRIAEDIKKRPDFYFMRYEIPYTNRDRKQAKTQLYSLLTRIKSDIENNSFYMNSNACEYPYKCEFLENCAGDSFTSLTKCKLFSELD